MKIFIRVCYFCYEDGEIVQATGQYWASEAHQFYDVCDDCGEETKKIMEKSGMASFEIEEIDEDDRQKEEE